MNEQEHIRRAEQTRQILESPIWIEAWAAFRDKMLSAFEDSGPMDVEEREQAKRLLDAGYWVRNHLESLLKNGKVATESKRLDDERKKRW